MYKRQGMNVRQVEALAYREKPGLLILDHLGLLEPPDTRLSLYEATTRNSRALKLLGLRLNVPVLCLCQLCLLYTSFYLFVRKRHDMCFLNTGQVYHVAGIACDVAQLYGLRKGLCQNTVDIAHSLCIEWCSLRDHDAFFLDDLAVLVPLRNGAAVGKQIIIEALNEVRREDVYKRQL